MCVQRAGRDVRRDINPHIPQFISKAPWYLGTNGYVKCATILTFSPTLSHQRVEPDKKIESIPMSVTVQHGVTAKAATRFRKVSQLLFHVH